MIHISLVSYLNTRPFIDGLTHFFSKEELTLKLLPPAECAHSLAKGECDLALMPAAALLDFKKLELLTDFCIGANGKVDSVFLFSDEPIKAVQTVILDSQSRSSNALTQILCKHFWRITPDFLYPKEGFNPIHKPQTAQVAIGDKAFAIRKSYRYVYDLAEAWQHWTGLPFVFAVWAYNPESLGSAQIEKLNKALYWGVNNIELSAQKWASEMGYTPQEALHYLSKSIDYSFDWWKHQALEKYLRYLKKNN